MTFASGLLHLTHPRALYANAMDTDLVEIVECRLIFAGRPPARCFNPVGRIQGGWAATMLNGAMAHCVHTSLRSGETFATLEIKINFVRPVLPSSGIVRCESKLVHRGIRTATSEGWLLDERGKLLAHGTETCAIFPVRPNGGPP